MRRPEWFDARATGYQEFGNVLAVTPRYTFDDDGKLKRVDIPIDEKEDLLDLESHADFLRSNDYHYEHWFKPHYVSPPYAADFVDDPNKMGYALYSALVELESDQGVSIPGIDPERLLSETTLALEQERVKYHEQLFDEKEDLFTAIVGEFVSYAEEQGFTPVLAMSQQLRYVQYELDHGPIYGDLMERLDEQFPSLTTIDVGATIRESDDLEEARDLYVQRGEGGHYSPEANDKIAQVLHDRLFA